MQKPFYACLLLLSVFVYSTASRASNVVELEQYIHTVSCNLNQLDQMGVEFANRITRNVETPGQAAKVLLDYGFFDYEEFETTLDKLIQKNINTNLSFKFYPALDKKLSKNQAFEVLSNFEDYAFRADPTNGSSGSTTIEFLGDYREKLARMLPNGESSVLSPQQIRIRQNMSLIDSIIYSLDHNSNRQIFKMIGRVIRQKIASQAVSFYFKQFGYFEYMAPTTGLKIVTGITGVFLGLAIDGIAEMLNIQLIQDHWIITLLGSTGLGTAFPWLHYHYRSLRLYDVTKLYQANRAMTSPVLNPDGTAVFYYNEASTQPIDVQTAIELKEISELNPLDVTILGKAELDKLINDASKVQSLLLYDSQQSKLLVDAASNFQKVKSFENRVKFIAALKGVDAAAHLPDTTNLMKNLSRSTADLKNDFTALQKFAVTGYEPGQISPNNLALGNLLHDRMSQNLEALSTLVRQLEEASRFDQEAQVRLNQMLTGWIRQAESSPEEAHFVANAIVVMYQ